MAYTQVGLNNTLKKLFHYLVPLLLVTSALHLKASADTLSEFDACLLYTSPSPRDQRGSRMPSSA